MGTHLVRAFAAEVPFPPKESPAVAHVGLLRFPGVPPQLQLGFDSVEDDDLVVRQVGMSPVAPHVGVSPKHSWSCRRESRARRYHGSGTELCVTTPTSYAEDSELEKQLLLFTPIRTIVSE